MNWKILVTILAGLALAACETTSEDTGAAEGGGSGSDTASSSPVSSSDLATRTPAGARAGTQEDLVVNVGDRIFFALDSHQLRPDARATLEKQSQWLRQNPSVTVTVEGHADERGTREYNLALGERRASAARDYLVALGINGNRVNTVSLGKERPVDPRSIKEAWAKNRRGVMLVN